MGWSTYLDNAVGMKSFCEGSCVLCDGDLADFYCS